MQYSCLAVLDELKYTSSLSARHYSTTINLQYFAVNIHGLFLILYLVLPFSVLSATCSRDLTLYLLGGKGGVIFQNFKTQRILQKKVIFRHIRMLFQFFIFLYLRQKWNEIIWSLNKETDSCHKLRFSNSHIFATW